MKIILDTNILRQDFFLKSRKFEMLIDFVSKTVHQIMLPQVVYDEIVSLYERAMLEKYGQLLKSKEDCEKHFLLKLDIGLPKLEIDKQIEAFKKNINNKLKINSKNIIPLNDKCLPGLVNRALKRIPPFSENKSEFRDAIIWLSCLDLALSEDEKSVIFISANTKDFSDKDCNLHPKLIEEATKIGVEIIYFTSLDDFLKSKASTIEFITKEWLEENINFDELEKVAIPKFEIYKKAKLSELANDYNNNFEEILSVIQCTNFWIIDFYVYEMSDGSTRVEVNFGAELEVEYSTREVVKTGWEMEYVFDHSEGDFDFEPVCKKKVIEEAGSGCFYPVADMELHILIRNEKIESTELVDWYV